MNEIKTYSPEYTNGEFGLTFSNEQKVQSLSSSETQQEKGVAEIQASFVIAKKFPRNENQVYLHENWDEIQHCIKVADAYGRAPGVTHHSWMMTPKDRRHMCRPAYGW